MSPSVIDLTDDKIKNVRALVYKKQKGQRLFLLTQELDGAFTLPGGCKDLEDPDNPSALKRELKEELGFEPSGYIMKDTQIKREYENLYKDPNSERFGKNTMIYLFLVEYNSQEKLSPGKDIKSISWFDEKTAATKLSGQHMKTLFTLGVQIIK
jgi:8-oxo-dGTP pyrophosphatase MutT (NUDIX family)